MNWFELLTGVSENPGEVQAHLAVNGNELKSLVNGKTWTCGELEIPSLAELRERVRASGWEAGNLSLREVVANVQELHTDQANAGALFQVASQFNLLEMVSPGVTPEEGVGIYENDHTQGPACAIAAGAGTIYRNYFAPLNGQAGQSVKNQIDCLADVGAALGNSQNHLWQMRNGYALASSSGLGEISQRLRTASESQIDELRQKLRIGIQWNTQVTLADRGHLVSQAYCSALPVAYTQHPTERWEEFARLILEAAYEATICTGMINSLKSGNKTVFLTLLGGGAFGNRMDWIVEAMRRSFDLYRHADLDVAIVSYGTSNSRIRELVQ